MASCSIAQALMTSCSKVFAIPFNSCPHIKLVKFKAKILKTN